VPDRTVLVVEDFDDTREVVDASHAERPAAVCIIF
jgi:hypothetical protein